MEASSQLHTQDHFTSGTTALALIKQEGGSASEPAKMFGGKKKILMPDRN
jgi:hypothetical protein